jgi:hypothetical protein
MKKLIFDLYFKFKNKELFEYINQHNWIGVVLEPRSPNDSIKKVKMYKNKDKNEYIFIQEDFISTTDVLSKSLFSKYISKNIINFYPNRFYSSEEEYLINIRQSKLEKFKK